MIAHSIIGWLNKNVGRTFKSPRQGARDIQILAVDDESGRLNIQFVGGVQALPLYSWMFNRAVNYLIGHQNGTVRLGAKLTPPYDPDTIEEIVWREPHPKPPRTTYKASPHVCDLLVLAGFARYQQVRSPSTGRLVQGITYCCSESKTEPVRIAGSPTGSESGKQAFVERYRSSIIRWAERNKDLIRTSRLAYRWKSRRTSECVKERNDISRAIILSRIKNDGGIDLDTLDTVTIWGFNRRFACRERDRVLRETRGAFTYLDSGDLVQATKTLLALPGVGISRASKILGLFDQENLCIYDSRVGQAIRDLTHEDNRIVLCPPGRNRTGDSVPNSDVWAEHYQRLIWALEIVRDFLNDTGSTFRLADVEMALFIMGR